MELFSDCECFKATARWAFMVKSKCYIVPFRNQEIFFCDHQSKKTIIFTICEICGSVQELVNNGLEHLVRSLEKDIDFLTNRSVIELKGICSTCKD